MKKTNDNWRENDPGRSREASRYERPIPSREFLLKTLAEAGTPLDVEALAKRLRIKDEGLRQALESRLAAMVRDGQLLRNRRAEYLLLDHTGLITGTVIGHRDGFGFLKPDAGGDDLFLPPGQMRLLMHGDRAAVRESGRDHRGRREGAVVEVLERRTRQVAGRFHLEHGVGFVTPDNRRIASRIVVPVQDRGPARGGELVVAELLQPPSAHAEAVGRITRVLAEERLVDTAVELAVAGHQLPHEFGPEVEREARAFGRTVTAAMTAGRLDLRTTPLVTIDGADARDFDDAVYAEATKTGWRVLVAIADVSYYVRPGGALDEEAKTRGTSVYFPGRVIPMLPERLSNELCSLMPQVDRLCMVCELSVSREGRITRSRFASAVMRSSARLTYEQVAAAIVAREPQARAAVQPVLGVLETLYDVYRALQRRREARGALDFESGEAKIAIGEDGRVADIKVVPRTDAHRLIEECMIAANVEAARFLKKHSMPGLYRVHARPDEERILDLQRFLATRGVHLETTGEIDAPKLARVLKQVHGRPDAAMLETMIIRSLAQAVYQPENIGHFGLALDEYAHFTSPIRRYPDLLVHRAIRHVLEGGGPENFVHSPRELEAFGQACSFSERRADEASRDVVAFLKCEYMRERVGEEFDGVVTGVVDFGLFVQLVNLQIDGLVHVANLGADYFRFEPDRKALVGERSRVSYTLGDRLRVRVARVEPSDRKIDLELVAQTSRAFHPRRASGGSVHGSGQKGGQKSAPKAAPSPGEKSPQGSGQRRRRRGR
jgi:ribonuclease R